MNKGREICRRPDWADVLEAFFVAAATEAFVWGRNDCCLFVTNALESITGHDPAAWFRGRYHDEIGAWEVLHRYLDRPVSELPAAQNERTRVFGPLIEAVSERLAAEAGWAEIAPKEMSAGDIALIKFRAGTCGLTIMDAQGRLAWVKDPEGLTFLPGRLASRAWRVV